MRALAVDIYPMVYALDKPPARHWCLLVLVRLGRTKNHGGSRAADTIAVAPLEALALLLEPALLYLATKLDTQEPIALGFRLESIIHVSVNVDAFGLTDTGARVFRLVRILFDAALLLFLLLLLLVVTATLGLLCFAGA